jgi:hypothetical protein
MKKINFYYKKPDHIPSYIFLQIRDLIKEHGDVLTSFLEENLNAAFLIGYAMDDDKVIGTSVHKHQKKEYLEKIEALTGLNLSGYLERGYTTVLPEYRVQSIADKIIGGLIDRSEGKKIYVTIRMDNPAPLKLTYKNNMNFAAKFIHHKTGHELGVFINQKTVLP